MKNSLKKVLLSTTLVLCANAALAFTPTGEVVETSDSALTTIWQPSAAQRGDTIAGACEGFAYNACVREFVLANRDMFPAQFTAESDFFLRETATYMVPTSVGVIASAEPATPTAEAPSLLEIMNGLSAEQERQAGEIASLTDSLSTLGVDDVDGLAASLQAISESVPDIGPLRAAVGGLEEALLLLQNGDLTEAMLTTIQSRIDASLTSLTADVEGLKQADIKFGERLTGFEVRIDGVETANAQATYWTSYKGLTIIFGTMLILAVGIIGSFYSNRRKVNGVVTAQKATDDKVDILEQKTDDSFSALKERIDTVDAKVDANAGELQRVGKQLTQVAETDSEVRFDADALKPAMLHAMSSGGSKLFPVHSLDGERTYMLKIERGDEDQYTIYGLLRQKDSAATLSSVAAANVATSIYRAAKGGRLIGIKPAIIDASDQADAA